MVVVNKITSGKTNTCCCKEIKSTHKKSWVQKGGVLWKKRWRTRCNSCWNVQQNECLHVQKTLYSCKRQKRTWFDSIGRATDGSLFTSAIPLLLGTECFCLLHLWPWPVRLSLYNLDSRESSRLPMLMSSLARTPDRHRAVTSGNPDLKPFQAPAPQATVTVGHQPNQPRN